MRLLFLVRDFLPAARPDVRVLFGRKLRERGVVTDIVGVRRAAGAAPGEWEGGREISEPDPPGPVARALRLLSLDLRMLRQATDYDAVIVRDQILTASIALLRVPRRKVVYWMSFPFPEEDAERAGLATRGRLFRHGLALRGRLTGWLLYRWVAPRAAHLFVQSPAMARLVASRAPRCAPMTPVPMGFDPEMVAALEPLERVPVPGQVVLGYLGAIDVIRRIDFMLEVLVWVGAQRPGTNFRLLMVGDGSTPTEIDWFRRRIDTLGLRDRVEITGALPMHDAWRRIREADIGLSTVPRGVVFDVSSPTKAVEYLALGLPAVVNDIPDQQALVAATRAGCCAPMEVEAFGRAILEVVDDLEGYRARALAAFGHLVAERSYDVLADRVLARLRETLDA
jgi:glycosyltransferase involved in cell wall biosynthesis